MLQKESFGNKWLWGHGQSLVVSSVDTSRAWESALWAHLGLGNPECSEDKVVLCISALPKPPDDKAEGQGNCIPQLPQPCSPGQSAAVVTTPAQLLSPGLRASLAAPRPFSPFLILIPNSSSVGACGKLQLSISCSAQREALSSAGRAGSKAPATSHPDRGKPPKPPCRSTSGAESRAWLLLNTSTKAFNSFLWW